MTWSSGSMRSAVRSRPVATASACCARSSRSKTASSASCTGSTTSSGAPTTRSSRTGSRVSRHRARVRAQGTGWQRAAGRAGARTVVPALGDPDLSDAISDAQLARVRSYCAELCAPELVEEAVSAALLDFRARLDAAGQTGTLTSYWPRPPARPQRPARESGSGHPSPPARVRGDARAARGPRQRRAVPAMTGSCASTSVSASSARRPSR